MFCIDTDPGRDPTELLHYVSIYHDQLQTCRPSLPSHCPSHCSPTHSFNCSSVFPRKHLQVLAIDSLPHSSCTLNSFLYCKYGVDLGFR